MFATEEFCAPRFRRAPIHVQVRAKRRSSIIFLFFAKRVIFTLIRSANDADLHMQHLLKSVDGLLLRGNSKQVKLRIFYRHSNSPRFFFM